MTSTQIMEGSGYPDLDEAALRVANQIEFTPALNGTERVPVRISLPITFKARKTTIELCATVTFKQGPKTPRPRK